MCDLSRGYLNILTKNFEEKTAGAAQSAKTAEKRICAKLIRRYYGEKTGGYAERKAVENALLKIECGKAAVKGEYDGIFSYFFENGRRNVNSVAIERWFSPSSVYRRLDFFCETVKKELGEMKKYTAVTVLRY